MALSVARRAVTMPTAALAALILAAGPAGAAVTANTSGGNRIDISSSASDAVSMACLGGDAAVNGVVALPAVPCGNVQLVDIADTGGTDNINLSNVTAAVFPQLTTVQMNVDDGAQDTVVGSAFRDEIEANFGPTGDIVSGGPGDDRIDGSQTADGGDGDDLLLNVAGAVQGGPGNDRIYDPGSGPLDGGPGSDTVEVDYTSVTLFAPLSIGVSDAGLSYAIGSLPAINYSAASIEAWVLTATDGSFNDTIDSRAYSGRTVVRGVAGDDVIRGGPAADYSDGGNGNDTIDPGSGADLVYGGPGNDTISTRDGVPDSVDCGDGTDSVTADRLDTLVSCESVSLPAPETDKISGPKKVTKGQKAMFTFGSPVSGARFECRVDKGKFKACKSPFKLSTKKLKVGKHTVQVRAVQPAGNSDPTPSKRTFKVVATK